MNLASQSGAARPPMANQSVVSQQAVQAQMMNASAAARIQANTQTLAAMNEQRTSAKTDKETLGVFLAGFLAAWALLPVDSKDIPKPKVKLEF